MGRSIILIKVKLLSSEYIANGKNSVLSTVVLEIKEYHYNLVNICSVYRKFVFYTILYFNESVPGRQFAWFLTTCIETGYSGTRYKIRIVKMLLLQKIPHTLRHIRNVPEGNTQQESISLTKYVIIFLFKSWSSSRN